jgi:hypothetical protein
MLPKTLYELHHFRHPLLLGLSRGPLRLQLRRKLLTFPCFFFQPGLQYFTPIFQ